MKACLRLVVAAVLVVLLGVVGFGDVLAAEPPEPFSVGEWPDRTWGFRDSAGNVVVQPIYSSVRPFSEGLAAVALQDSDDDWGWGTELWGFIDLAGRVVVPLIYDQVGDFSEGLAAVRQGDLFGFIDRTGTVVVPIFYDMVTSFSGGFAGVGHGSNRWDGTWGVIDTRGRVVVPVSYSFEEIGMILDVMALPAGLVPSNVEQLHWSEVRRILPLRTPFRITDIGTGIYYYVISMSNGNHADVETVTAADTARLFESFGGQQT